MSTELRPEVFRRSLLRMKRDGCSIVVCSDGDVSTARASRRALGSAPSYPRVLVSTDDDENALENRLPREIDLDSERVSVVRAREVLDRAADPQTGVDDLCDSVRDAVQTFEVAGGLGPGELRLNIDSMSEIAATVGRESAASVSNDITDSVRGVRGMAYFHVDDDDAEIRDVLAESCDARVDVRADGDGDGVRQRWHLPEKGSTGWLHL